MGRLVSGARTRDAKLWRSASALTTQSTVPDDMRPTAHWNVAAATGDSERLWSLPDARWLAADEEFDAESGYGFSVLGGRAVAVPRAGWSRSG